jgi:3D (Asp-Asp-Asp) domain-containing protein
VNGKKKKTKKEFDHWIRKPTNIQLRFGTSVTGESGDVEFDETFIGNCTAYYFGNNAHGATGQRCHYGTCAVDPRVIPYGTKLYVEGYGTAVANDCGGAVKGHIIDLYMRSTKECFSWGRRNKKVYILK